MKERVNVKQMGIPINQKTYGATYRSIRLSINQNKSRKATSEFASGATNLQDIPCSCGTRFFTFRLRQITVACSVAQEPQTATIIGDEVFF
jgi:hypothetical protein